MQKLLTFFQQNINSIYAIFNGQSFNDTLTNDIVSFEQLDPDQNLHCYPRIQQILDISASCKMNLFIF